MADYTLHLGDCLDVMRTMNANSVDTVVCDPPYGLSFMGKDWDHGVPGIPFWQAALRVAKPGAMLLAFGGTRTHHRLMCAIEDAGWEIRDVVMWLYGSGFPKSHDISKGIDKAAGAKREVVESRKFGGRNGESATAGASNGGVQGAYNLKDNRDLTAPATPLARDWHGWGTALKPAYEPIVLAMKPLDGTFAQNAALHGVAGLNIDGARIGTDSIVTHGGGGQSGSTLGWSGNDGRKEPTTRVAINEAHTGRWPANLILDEEAARLLDEQTGDLGGGAFRQVQRKRNKGWANSSPGDGVQAIDNYGDSGGASRFFYTAKASRSERERGLEGMEEKATWDRNSVTKAYEGMGSLSKPMTNHHPTVKPLALMRYLVRLTSTPTGGIVLDPFMGSGSTGIAALQEGRSFVGIELDGDYYAIAEKRIANVMVQPELEAVR